MRKALAAGLLVAVSPAAAEGVDTAREAELKHVVRQDCGACHGLTLAGGLGSDIRPDAIAGHTVDTLATIILDGLPGTAMPPWRPLLSEADARWIAACLIEGTAP
ncbi:MAG: cytochrome c [Pseudomonadota bacterium]